MPYSPQELTLDRLRLVFATRSDGKNLFVSMHSAAGGWVQPEPDVVVPLEGNEWLLAVKPPFPYVFVVEEENGEPAIARARELPDGTGWGLG